MQKIITRGQRSHALALTFLFTVIGTTVYASSEEELLRAAKQGDIHAVQQALKNEADVDAADAQGTTALMFAASEGHTQIVKLLLEYDANIDAQNDAGWTAAKFARSRGHTATLRRLEGKVTPDGDLLSAAVSGDLQMAQAALKNGANPDTKRISRLSHGALAGYWKPDPNIGTPLMLAAKSGASDVAELLIEHDADVNAMLTEAGVITTDGGFTTTWLVSHHGHIDVNEYPSIAKISGTKQEGKGWTSLMFAALHGHVELVKLLLAHGARRDAVQHEGWTALMFAAYFGHTDVAKLLLAGKTLLYTGFNAKIPDQETIFWRTTIYFAKKLMRRKAYVQRDPYLEMKTEGGQTALCIAVASRHTAFANLLREYGANEGTCKQ